MTRKSASPVAARTNPRAKVVFPAPRSPCRNMTPPTGSVSLSRAKVANSDPISSISSSVGTWMPRLVEGRRVDVVVVVVVCLSKRLLAEPTKEGHVDDGPFANAKTLQPNRNDSIVWKCCKCCTSHGSLPVRTECTPTVPTHPAESPYSPDEAEGSSTDRSYINRTRASQHQGVHSTQQNSMLEPTPI